jgi:sulfur relay (sulfurtransferase) complex TusBCD TusD component (DsrE family)
VERVNHSEYGYAGFFDAVKVRETDLDRMMNYDVQLLQMSDSVVNAINAFDSSVENSNFQDAKMKVKDALKAVDAFENAYNGRKQVIMGAQ